MSVTAVGLVGYPASGKDTAALYFSQQHNFIHVSTGDMIREYIKENNLGKATRELLQKVGNELRLKNGAGFFACEAIQKNSEKEKIIVSGIRTVGEALEIKKLGGIIIAVDVSQKVRFERAQARGSARDNRDFEAFKAVEDLEAQHTDPNVQNVLAVINMADYKIVNEGTVEELYGHIDQILNQISPRAL